MVNKKPKVYDRYKIEIVSLDIVIRTLGVPANRRRVRVMEVTRRELNSVSTATHAVIRSLDGTEHTVYAKDGWWRYQMKAFQL